MTAPAPRVPAGSVRREDAGKTVLVKGWVHRRRDHGELVFVDLRDRSGILQVVFDAEFLPSEDLLARAKELRSEFVLEVTGEVILRDPAAVNGEMPTGEVEVRATALELLNRAETPPFQIEDSVKASEDLRLKYRYLDLRRPEMTSNLVRRSDVTYRVRQVLHESNVRVGVTARPLDGELPTGHGMANSFGPEAGEAIRDKAQLRSGDVVMFLGTYGPASWANSITHVGVYVGDGMMVDRSTASAPVQLRSVDTFRFGGAIRLHDQGARP